MSPDMHGFISHNGRKMRWRPGSIQEPAWELRMLPRPSSWTKWDGAEEKRRGWKRGIGGNGKGRGSGRVWSQALAARPVTPGPVFGGPRMLLPFDWQQPILVHTFDCHAQPEGLLVDGSSRGNSRRPYSFAIYRFFVGVLFYEVLKCYIPENKMLVGVRRIICLQRVQISTDFVQVSWLSDSL